MKNRSLVALLTVIAILLGANLVVLSADSVFAQDRPQRPEQPERPERPVRPQPPEREEWRRNRCVGITAVGNQIYLAFEDGSVQRREVR